MRVFLSNSPALGNDHCVLYPTNGPGDVWVWDPNCCDYIQKRVPQLCAGGVVFNARDCFINDVPHQTIPYLQEFFLYLKLKTSGDFYLNAMPLFTSSSRAVLNVPGLYGYETIGFPVDNGTKHGTLVGLIWRDPFYDLQGQANSEYVSSYYEPGRYSFIVNPVGNTAGPGVWTTCAGKVEVLVFGRYAPWVAAHLNFTSNTPGSAMSGRVIMDGSACGSPGAGFAPSVAGYPEYVGCDFPMINFIDGLRRFEVQILTNTGTATLGAATNSELHVQANF